MSGVSAILRVGRRQWGWMAAGIVLGMIVISANALLMALAGWFIASMAVSGLNGGAFDYFVPSAVIRALALVRTIGRYGERLVTHEGAFRFLADLRSWLFRRLVPLAPAGLERYAGGDVVGRLRGDVDSLESLYLRVIAPLAVGSCSILLAVAFVAFWNLPSSLVLCGVLLMAGLALPLLGRRLSVEPGHAVVRLTGELRTAVTEGLQGVEELILLGATELHGKQVCTLSRRLVEEQQRLGRINAVTMSVSAVCAGLGMAGVLAAACPAVNAGALTGPELVMLLLFSAASFEAASMLPHALQTIPAVGEALRRICQLTDALPPVPDPPLPGEPLPSASDIVFRDVCCSYVDGLPVLQNFNLRIPAGSRAVLVGPSGSGKSTIVEILLRFRDYSGSITVGGTELRKLAGDDVRRLFSVLPQQPHLFNTSIRENILLARPNASEEELQTVLFESGLAPWVTGLPMGLDTAVGEGACSVSGGEARRIALARALLKDAPVLLLDEPTEGLDASMEQEVVTRLAKRIRGKTALIISHRPACTALADQVIRLSESTGGVSHG
ncbi:MAG: thiol reductant ABC exporter subunit CydC [Desulfuromonadales bacterium]|nr:thiol reductant ABC exporter subunit CydC [Desulfuromonadales bacterium]